MKLGNFVISVCYLDGGELIRVFGLIENWMMVEWCVGSVKYSVFYCDIDIYVFSCYVLKGCVYMKVVI